MNLLLKKDSINVLAIKVYKDHPETRFDCNDDWALSGIYRDAYLLALPKYHIENYGLTTDADFNQNTARIRIAADVRRFLEPADEAAPLPQLALRAELRDADGQLVAQQQQPVIWPNSDFMPEASLALPVKTARWWTAETPYLYQLTLSLLTDGQVVHTRQQKYGLREVSIENGVLKINQQSVKIRGSAATKSTPK
ncbi:MAG: hypothetical protein HC880_21825 [Bacteroidia bacterium]|nr:hypothetical protein [Bacteroidia bacterium]